LWINKPLISISSSSTAMEKLLRDFDNPTPIAFK
jgi:hypothetical protein